VKVGCVMGCAGRGVECDVKLGCIIDPACRVVARLLGWSARVFFRARRCEVGVVGISMAALSRQSLIVERTSSRSDSVAESQCTSFRRKWEVRVCSCKKTCTLRDESIQLLRRKDNLG
jgi:hypothetical protein